MNEEKQPVYGGLCFFNGTTVGQTVDGKWTWWESNGTGWVPVTLPKPPASQ